MRCVLCNERRFLVDFENIRIQCENCGYELEKDEIEELIEEIELKLINTEKDE